MSDQIGDMLTRIRNAQAVGKESVELPYSKVKEKIAKVLQEEGFLKDVRIFKEEGKKYKMLNLTFSYEEGMAAISGIKRVSKPGRRIYKTAKDIQPVLGGAGISIISTSRGIMTGKEAKKKFLGGEIICEVW